MRTSYIFQCIVVLLTKHLCQPTCRISGDIIRIEAVYIISHIKEKGDLCFSPFQVSAIRQPDTIGSGIIRLTKFFIHQCRRGSTIPQIAMRNAQIRYMIVNACTSGTLLFLRTTQTFHITEIIIRPDNCNIIRQFQSVRIDFQHFLIRRKCLWDCFNRFVDMPGNDISLSIQCTFQHFNLFPHRHISTTHSCIMQAS